MTRSTKVGLVGFNCDVCNFGCLGKAKMEQHKTSLLMDLNSSRHTLEELNMEKAIIEKNNKMMQVYWLWRKLIIMLIASLE